MPEIKSCPTCGSKRIRRVRKSITRTYQRRNYTVLDVEFYECPACGERRFDRDAMKKIEAHSPAYQKAIA